MRICMAWMFVCGLTRPNFGAIVLTGVFLGFQGGGYRILNIKKNVITSGSVKFYDEILIKNIEETDCGRAIDCRSGVYFFT